MVSLSQEDKRKLVRKHLKTPKGRTLLRVAFEHLVTDMSNYKDGGESINDLAHRLSCEPEVDALLEVYGEMTADEQGSLAFVRLLYPD